MNMQGDEESRYVDEKRIFVGEYVGLAEYIDFSGRQRKIVSWFLTIGIPCLIFSVCLFLLSFFISSFSESTTLHVHTDRYEQSESKNFHERGAENRAKKVETPEKEDQPKESVQ